MSLQSGKKSVRRVGKKERKTKREERGFQIV